MCIGCGAARWSPPLATAVPLTYILHGALPGVPFHMTVCSADRCHEHCAVDVPDWNELTHTESMSPAVDAQLVQAEMHYSQAQALTTI